MTFRLKRHDLDKRDPALVLHGRVLNERGKPVAGATLEPVGYMKGDTGQFGALKDFDELAVTNEQGEFRLGVPEAGMEVYLLVSAPFMAPAAFPKRSPGPAGHDLTVNPGVTVTGRLVRDGKPLSGAAVGLVQKDRSPEGFLGEFQAAADDDGKFRIQNVPAEVDFVCYGKMETFRGRGALPVKATRTGASKSSLDLGTLEAIPGLRLTGRVVLSDGKPVPPGTQVSLGREEAWDNQVAAATKDGSFAFDGLPPERYTLSAGVPGYHVSPKNLSFEILNCLFLSGMVREDIKGLRLLLEPGDPPRRPEKFDKALSDEYRRRRESPLRGAPEDTE